MRVLVTGAAGFIGSGFVSFCRAHSPDWELIGFDDLSTGYRENIVGLDLPLVVGSVTNREEIVAAADDADAIVHLAALGSVPRSVADPVTSHDANLTGTLNVLEAARLTNSHVVFASSSSVYGANTKLPKNENDWTLPMSPYAATKLGAEGYVLAYQSSYELATLAFRFFNVYGPRQHAGHPYAAVIPKFLEAIFSGTELTVYGDGEQSRDFTYVDTVAAILHDAVQRRIVSRHPINLAFNTNTTINELANLLLETTGKDAKIRYVDARPGDVRGSRADGQRVRELFPQIGPVPLSQGVLSAVKWFAEQVETS